MKIYMVLHSLLSFILIKPSCVQKFVFRMAEVNEIKFLRKKKILKFKSVFHTYYYPKVWMVGG